MRRAAHSAGKYRGITTPGGVSLPQGWNLIRTDTFGTGGSVANYAQLHALYDEGQYYNKDTNGLIVSNPINSQQQTYQHFETSIAFSTDHLTIQGRGQVGGAINSCQMSSHYSSRSFCYEGRFQCPSAAGTWAEFWAYPIIAAGSDASEIDGAEMVISSDGSNPTLSTHMVSLANHPTEFTNIVISDPNFTTTFMFYTNASFDHSTAPHYYTMVYDDVAKKQRRYIDGHLIYTSDWTWMASLGGTGFGTDANLTIDLAAGGSFPGTIASPASYTGDLNIYSLGYYSPVPNPTGQAWDQSHKCGSVFLSNGNLTATAQTVSTNQVAYALSGKSSGKYYWETTLTSSNIASMAAGLGVTIVAATGLVGTTAQGQYLGQQNYMLGWYPGAAFTNNGGAGGAWPSFASGNVLCHALDLDTKLYWVRVGPTGLWFGLSIGSQNPAVGSQVGGYSLPSTIQTNVCPAINFNTSSDTAVGAFASGSWAGAAPTGFGPF